LQVSQLAGIAVGRQEKASEARSMSPSSRFFGPIALLFAACSPAAAERLGEEACAKLKVEQAALEQAGVRSNFGRGPEWAKANLSADKLEQIRVLIDIDEQLRFRCKLAKPLIELPEEPKDEPKAGDARAPKGLKPGASTKAAKVTPAPTAGDGKSAVKEKATAPKAASKVGESAPHKAKPKADDAYRRPPADAASDPFASQIERNPKKPP
jgi:hypothetical protein